MADQAEFKVMSKCDLHVHSKCSARSEEWLFRKLDFPDSCSDPGWLHAELWIEGWIT
jgi:hypothetical protein